MSYHQIELPIGHLKGVKRKSLYDDEYYSFEGIPFAKPPVGELRFKAPQAAEPWQGILDCSNYANKPVQNNVFEGKVDGSEDCLYLNVYVKKVK